MVGEKKKKKNAAAKIEPRISELWLADCGPALQRNVGRRDEMTGWCIGGAIEFCREGLTRQRGK